MLDWLIVGGGLHGTHLARILTSEMEVPAEGVRVLDPHPAPLARWRECTRNTGMRLLRSPYVHQIDSHPFSLRRFSRSPGGRGRGGLVGFYGRPTLDLFDAHCDAVIRENGMDALRVVGRAGRIERVGEGYRVSSDAGEHDARRVVLALGASEHPHWPAWSAGAREGGAPVSHVFDPGFDRESLPEWEHAVVVGGGITAAQTALAMADRRPGRVTLVLRHPMRVRQFDSDPGWVGPRYLGPFARERDPARRREIIHRARHRGSMPGDVAAELRRALVTRILSMRTGTPIGLDAGGEGWVLRFDDELPPLMADRLVLATGFDGRRPGGFWIDEAVRSLSLPCAPCGYPIVDRDLQWASGLFVSGPLAELEIGPAARNIVGARMTADRLRAFGGPGAIARSRGGRGGSSRPTSLASG